MILNYLVTGYRSLTRHKLFSFVTVFGLSLGIGASLLLLHYVAYELSFDDFHTNATQVYRIQHETYRDGALENSSASSYYGAAPAIQETFPEVLSYVRLHHADGMFSYVAPSGAHVSYYEREAFYADSSFFSVFSFRLKKGDVNHVLRNPKSLVISETAAKKYFGKEDPMGKTISLTTEWQGGEYTVDGVFADVPENTHLRFDFLFSIENLLNNEQFKFGAWYWTNFNTYLMVKPGTNAALLESKLHHIIDKNLGRQLKQINSEERFLLQPLNDIHLHPKFGAEAGVGSEYQTISFLLIVAFIIVGIAWINYINLSTARATERAREVGMRKVMGSSKVQLIIQFLLESSLLSFIGISGGVVLFLAASPYFRNITGFAIPLSTLFQQHWGLPVVIVIAGTFLAGVYPAFVLSGFRPLAALKGKFIRTRTSAAFRQGMVVFQFATCVFLIIVTLTIYRQLEYMRNQDSGMVINEKIILRAPKLVGGESYSNEISAFKNVLKQFPQVKHVALSSEVPGKGIFWTNEFRKLNEQQETRRLANILATDEGFIPAYDIKILAGRNFMESSVADLNSAIVVNEVMLGLLGIADPQAAINQEVIIGEFQVKKIIGVVKNFNQQSVKEKHAPIIMMFIPWLKDYMTISVPGHAAKETLDAIRTAYLRQFPDNAFEYFFLDEFYGYQFKSEERSWSVFILFSLLSMVIACLGLFALSSFILSQKSKEVAIRKVLGASVKAITMLLSSEFLKFVAISIAVAAPCAWIIMNKWLQNFAYHVDLSWSSIAFAGSATVSVAALTIGIQTIKAALKNPVDAIKED
jgi:putative ABC transport system permease protein